MLSKPDYAALSDEYDQRIAGGESSKEIRVSFESRGIHWRTFQNRRRQAKKAHQSTPEGHHETPEVHPSTPYEVEVLSVAQGTPEAHQSIPDESELLEVHQTTPAHQGTLEEYQEVVAEVHQSVPDAPHVGSEERTPEHPSTPVVHPELSEEHSGIPEEHSGVPARQDHRISTPMVHPGTPSAEDWELWTTIKGRWTEIEKMLAEWQSRRALLSTPSDAPRHTVEKTYVVDTAHVQAIDDYAREHGLEIKDVVYLAFQRFFENS
jgi:hypothetical protein